MIRPDNASDEEIMRHVRAGEVSLVGVLFERHHRRLFRYFWRMTRQVQASEDLVQEVFMRVLRHRETFRDGHAVGAWLISIARNAHHDGWRRKRLERPMEDGFDAVAPAGIPIERRQELARLAAALDELPAEQREIIVFHRYLGMSHAEIAETLGCDEGASRGRLHRALQNLRQAFLAATPAMRRMV